MSSDEDFLHEPDKSSTKAHRDKRRRLRACDMCRRRKVRCDGGAMPNNTCSNCIAFKYKCTYVETALKRMPDPGYVESLETQLAEMRKTLNKYRQVCPNVTLSDDPTGTPPALGTPSADSSQSPFSASEHGSPQPHRHMHMHPHPHPHPQPLTPTLPASSGSPMSMSRSPIPVDEDDLDTSDDEVRAHKTLAQNLADVSLYTGREHFLGKSSNLMFLQTAIDMRKDYGRETVNKSGVSVDEDAASSDERVFESKRLEFWNEHPWMMRAIAPRPLQVVFPDADLIDTLIEVYFNEFNIYMPLLHRPTFERDVREGLHLRDVDFGCILLLVCALGARFTDDERVLLDDYNGNGGMEQDPEEYPWHSAGWKWFLQVQERKNMLNLAPPTLCDLQILCLASMFTCGTSTPHISWAFVGTGLRYAQDLGAHRRKSYNEVPNVQDELLKRAFWILVYLDRTLGSLLGRPCGIQDEDLDVDLPIECDDDYWINPDPNLAFKQPEGKPSTVMFFNCALRLTQILAFALRTIYSINKSKSLLGFVGPQWQQHIVAELDSAMNRWIDSVPDHLRWNPHMENLVFLSQSAQLYASYYTLQITVHRPFIPSPRKPSGVSFPSLAICTNAARSCIHVLDVQAKRARVTSHWNMCALITSGIVLLLHIWGAKRSGTVADPVKEMKDVHKAMNMVKDLEPRWYTAGRVWDILYNLANVGDLPLPSHEVQRGHKRARGSESPVVHETSLERAVSEDGVRTIAGTKRVQQYQQQANSSPSLGSGLLAGVGDVPFSLPIHSDELGRLPLHPFFGTCTSPGSSMSSPVQAGQAWFADSFGPMPGLPPAPASAPAPAPALPAPAPTYGPAEPLDAAAFETIFNMIPPTSYQQTVLPQPLPSVPQDAVPPYQQNLMSILSENLENLMAQTSAPAAPAPPSSDFDSGALSMWSDAPVGFEWDDWGTYLTHFGGA